MKNKLSASVAVFTLTFASLAMAQVGQSSDSAASGPPRFMTEAALACILGAAPRGCETVFEGGARPVALGFVWKAGSLNPYYRSTTYAGRNAAGDEVWLVQFIHSQQTYVISRPDSDGKIRRLSVLAGSPDRQCVDLPIGDLRNGIFKANCGVLGSS
jgi:hypothetical protein